MTQYFATAIPQYGKKKILPHIITPALPGTNVGRGTQMVVREMKISENRCVEKMWPFSIGCSACMSI
jgi:hypothetical protein